MLLAPSGKGRKRQKKGDFGRFRPISRKGGQTPLKPPFVTPPFAASQNLKTGGYNGSRGHRSPLQALGSPYRGLFNCLIVGHIPGFNCTGPRGASKNIGLGRT